MLDIDAIINYENRRQNNEICLIASENICSKKVREYMSSCLTNKYAEGYPGHRYYGGCHHIDEIENLAINLACKLFKCNYANVQPHSGSQANQAVYLALLKPGDTILGMDLNAGGHLTHGSKVSSSGKLYNSITYGLDENGIINYEEIEQKLYKFNPKLLIIGASAYSRVIDYKKIKFIVDSYDGARMRDYLVEHPDTIGQELIDKFRTYIMVDMAHIAGLVATGLHPSPLPYADVVTSTTHKTLRGPRGGLILWNNDELTNKINKAVFPGIQGGPLEHIIAAKAQCFYEALQPEFKEYSQQTINNTKELAYWLKQKGHKLVTGGTDNHLILLDLTQFNISGKQVEDALGKCGIIVNKNMIWNDSRKPNETSGIRIGMANVTTRKIPFDLIVVLAGLIDRVIKNVNDERKLLFIKNGVNFIVSKLERIENI